jgi:Uma2 family endonuclease
MAKELNKVQYYYDFHPTEEDLMGETSWHDSLIDYLKAVLRWLFRGQTCTIYSDLNFYQTRNPKEYPVVPDLAVIKGTAFRHTRNWALTGNDPAPQVVFEILSEDTWKKDVREKPSTYASMGVQEYFTYDPHEPRLRRGDAPRLMGWRLDAQRQEMVEIVANREGWLWSEQLESWLVPDEAYLRLYDRDHQMRLTGEEAQAQQAEIATERAEIEAERAEAATERAEIEAERAKVADEQAKAAMRKAEALAKKLRSLGINPDEI